MRHSTKVTMTALVLLLIVVGLGTGPLIEHVIRLILPAGL